MLSESQHEMDLIKVYLLQGTAKFLRDILTLVTKEEQEYPSIDY